jgi:two-component system, cell cycle sensor histidine kinase and response regulator CckA
MPSKPTYEELEARIRALEKEIACRRESEQVLADIGHNYRALVENTPDIFYRTDLTGAVQYASPSVYRQSGYTVNEVIGINLAEQIYAFPAERKLFLKELGEKGFVRNFEARLKRKDGSTWWACTNAQFFRGPDGSVLGVEGITRDITSIKAAEEEQKRVRQELEASHKMLNSFLNAVPDLLIVIDRDFNIRYSNYREQDQAPGHVIEKRQTCYARFKKLAVPCEDCSARAVFDSGQIAERQMVNPADGRTCEARAFPIFDDQGRVEMVVEHIRDITEQKKMEAERQNYEARLQQIQKMEALGTLAGGIAHDFNNILVAVIGYAELSLGSLAEESPLYRKLQQILQAGMRARDLVHQILTFSRQEKREPKPLQIGNLIKEALEMLRSTLPVTIEIVQHLSPNEENVMADPTQIHQIIINLCTNAAQAMEEEGGLLTIDLSQVHLTARDVSAHPDVQPGSYVKLSVQDTGKGIPPDIIGKIFHPYFTTKDKGKGTGLGLAMVHGIINSYGGFIDVKSRPGKGTVFHVYIPTIGQLPAHDDPQRGELATGKEHILLVDDEPLVIEVLQEILQLQGYRITSADGSLKALETFRKAPRDFDLVITDMTMPKLTGDRLSLEIKKIRADIPIILCTGYSDKLVDKSAMDFGVQDFMVKPIKQADLVKTVRNVLDKASSDRRNIAALKN